MTKSKGDPLLDNSGLSQEIKDSIDIDIEKYGLSTDVKHSLLSLMPLPLGLGGELNKITQIQEYEEYFRDKTYGDYTISKSEPELVKEWNSKVRAFNDDLERIRHDKDEQKAKAFYEDMMGFFR